MESGPPKQHRTLLARIATLWGQWTDSSCIRPASRRGPIPNYSNKRQRKPANSHAPINFLLNSTYRILRVLDKALPYRKK